MAETETKTRPMAVQDATESVVKQPEFLGVMAMTALLQLIKCGQSYWLDNLTRRKITSGELNKRVGLQGLRGVTSNPAIFDKAISGGDDYDAQLQQLVHAGCEVHEIYERLVISDIQDACDILRPV